MDDYTSCETNLKIPISSWGRTSLALKRSQIEIDRGRLSSEGDWVLYMLDFLVAGDKKRNAPKSHSVSVRRSRVELPHHFWHYLLRVARLPISPPALKSGTKIRNIFLISGIFLEKLLKVIFEDS